MNSRKDKVLLNLLLGAGVYFLNSMLNSVSDTSVDNLRATAHKTYDTAADRVSRATDIIRGTDRPMISSTVAALLGFGIGASVSLLLTPASETRSNLASTARKISERVSSREPATGTFGA